MRSSGFVNDEGLGSVGIARRRWATGIVLTVAAVCSELSVADPIARRDDSAEETRAVGGVSDFDLGVVRERFKTRWRLTAFDQRLFHFRCLKDYNEYMAGEAEEAGVADRAPARERREREILERWVNALREDGSWPDLDYGDQRRADWPLKVHTGRAAILAIASVNSIGEVARGDRALRDAAVLAARYWIAHDYKCPNWYPNQISIPENLSVVFLFAGEDFTTSETAKAFKIMGRSKAVGGGSNLAELASTQIALGCLSGKPDLVADAFRRLAADIRIHPGEGIQADWSYHYHGPQLYSGAYGAVHTRSFGELAALAAGTRFAFPDDKVDILYRYVLDGQRWMVYRDLFDYGAIGRSITLIDAGDKVTGLLRPGIEALTRVAHPRQEEMKTFLREIDGRTSTLSGNRYFPKVDFMVHRRPEFYASTRMFSADVANAEVCNLEGEQTHHIADGANFLLQTGREYENIFPVWDWRRVPGITAERFEKPLEGNPRRPGPPGMVAGVSDGTRGVAAFDFECGPLRARKAWFCFDLEYVCLGAGIDCPTGNPVATSVNQCLLNSPVRARVGGATLEVDRGNRAYENLRWAHHDGVGYLFPNRATVVVANEAQTGSWNSINGNLSRDAVSKDVFSLWIEHGRNVVDGGYAYIVMPRTDAGEMEARVKASPIEIVENGATIQAVWNRAEKALEAVFWSPGRIEIPGGLEIAADTACLVVVEDRSDSVKIALAAPGSTSTVNVEVNRPLVGEGCEWNADGKMSRIAMAVPSGEAAGTSVSHEFQRYQPSVKKDNP